jgi:septal ring factor EnvC (AmiA/AmiB activator)
MNRSSFYRYANRKAFFILATLFICLANLWGQDKKELEEKKTKTQKDIEYTNQLLQETQSSRKNTLQRVRILNKRIQLRNEIIENINGEINIIEKEIKQKDLLISQLEQDLENIREQYAELIVKAYWNRDRRDWLLFIMSAENFNQAYRRMKYLQQFSRHRREQAELIKRMQEEIIGEIENLEKIKMEKEALALEKKNENHSLEQEKAGKNRLVSDLIKKENELKQEIEAKKKIADRLEKEIAAIIAEEARKARSRNIYEQLTPEEKLISDNFQGNKGKLPWPVERGIITQKFGEHPHPVLKQVTVDNDGVDIATIKGAEARASFDGEVSKIVAILGANYTVILRHGNFLTVYQNLVDLKVKQGDKVKVKQVLGTVYTDNEANNTILHMQIWKERSIQDPEDWLSRK